MATVVFDVAEFRVRFPEFADDVQYPDSVLEANFTVASCYISPDVYGCWSEECLTQALYLLVAHITRINAQIATGTDPAIIASATIDKVSITRMTPAERNSWQFWLNQTPYGQQLLALLKVTYAAGTYVGGMNERAPFRQVGGVYIK